MGLFTENKNENEQAQRFVEVYCSSSGANSIFVDTVTGVNYFFHRSRLDSASGLTVLVDADGKPFVTPPETLAEIVQKGK